MLFRSVCVGKRDRMRERDVGAYRSKCNNTFQKTLDMTPHMVFCNQ